MSSLPGLVLDIQMDLIHWCGTPKGQRYLTALDHANHIPPGSFMWLVRHSLVVAEPYAVTTELCDVIEAAAQSVPDYELQPSDLPTETGFIFFERPLLLPDHQGATIAVRGVTWTPAIANSDPADDTIHISSGISLGQTRGLVMVLLTDPTHPGDHMHDEWTAFEQDGAVTFLTHGLVPMAGGTWDWGTVPGYELCRTLMTFFRFVGEPWVDDRMVTPERPVVRRAQRARRIPQVRVVELRKHENPPKRKPGDEEPAHVEWSHRWIVEGFWRNQWYPSEQRHAPKWIHPYVKGPDDKPLIVKDRIFHVRR